MAPVATPQDQVHTELKKPHQTTANLSSRPLERLWRGNKAGTVRMSCPDFKGDKYAERQWIKEHMVENVPSCISTSEP